MGTKTRNTPLTTAETCGLSCWPSSLAPESKLSHNLEFHPDLVPRLSHHRGKNTGFSSLKNHFHNAQLFLVKRSGTVVWLFPGCKSRSDGWCGRRLLSGCLHTRKSLLSQHQRHSLKQEKGFFQGFLLINEAENSVESEESV